MSNLRWIVRDGKEELAEIYCHELSSSDLDTCKIDGSCHLRPIQKISLPEKKSLAQVLFSAAYEVEHIFGANDYSFWANDYSKKQWERVAQAAMDYLEKEGWRRPNGA